MLLLRMPGSLSVFSFGFLSNSAHPPPSTDAERRVGNTKPNHQRFIPREGGFPQAYKPVSRDFLLYRQSLTGFSLQRFPQAMPNPNQKLKFSWSGNTGSEAMRLDRAAAPGRDPLISGGPERCSPFGSKEKSPKRRVGPVGGSVDSLVGPSVRRSVGPGGSPKNIPDVGPRVPSQGAWGFVNSDKFAGDLFVHRDALLQQFQARAGDKVHFASPKKPWTDDSPVNTTEQWFPMGFRPSTVHLHSTKD